MVLRKHQNSESELALKHIISIIIKSNLNHQDYFRAAKKFSDERIGGFSLFPSLVVDIEDSKVRVKLNLEAFRMDGMIQQASHLQSCIYEDVKNLTGYELQNIQLCIKKILKKKAKDA
ncbi:MULTISPECIES: hypothetical protein [unclassified Bacillus (in: firmicutes)]|uniref:hypothetical protein n=1 Tax=unclassified Bacillus (in: firmicutes) TaxID=185979 RepID=UPI0008F32276|nr:MULTISPECIES: hypothetical protein [unclassified Bacillus (in: firmicutes)]SFA76000.1 hypothetical protein SAMN02799634_101560 [Bacillus sp. UNCCL13]SFQ65975.1 hypothetical protein SAMN04488577_0835 [Bacillus sp. cl95]